MRETGERERERETDRGETGEKATVLVGFALLTLDTVGGEEADVAGLQRIVVGELGRSALRLRLARQGRVVHLERG